MKVDISEQQRKKEQLQLLNSRLQDQNQNLGKDVDVLYKMIDQKNKEYQSINREYNILEGKLTEAKDKADNYYIEQKSIIDKRLEDYQNEINKIAEMSKRESEEAAQSYFDNIQEAYKSADAAHREKMTALKEEQDQAAASLNKIVQTRNQAYQAILKQKQIKAKQDDYRLLPSKTDLEDIYALQHIKQGLHKPRILSMLIWQTYFQPIAKKQFPVILQDKTKMGIYKVTNIKTNQSYIGQSVDIYKRWTDHCKAGLGIDTPAGNKLYKAMQEYGLQNFTFELLSQCDKQQLDEKERYFIELYQADLFGYNSTKGNK